MVDKYKSTKCIGHLFGRTYKRKTRVTTDRRKSASTVKVKIQNELRISLHVDTIRKRAHEVGRVACKKPYMNRISRGERFKFGKEMLEKPVDFWKNIVVWFDE